MTGRNGAAGARRLRIGLITPGYPPTIGGIERHVEMLAQGLTGNGMEVEVATLDVTGSLPEREVREGVAIRRFRPGRRRGRLHLSASIAAWLWHHAGDFDVIHAHGYHTPVAAQAALAARRRRVPFIVSPHYHGTGHTLAMRLLHVPYGPVGAWMMRSATRIICDSHAERDLVVRHFGHRARTTVIPVAVEVDKIRNARPFALKDGATVVLGVGRLEAYKGVERVIHAMQFLPDGYRLVLIGDGSARSALAALVEREGLAARVSLLGFVERSQLDRWYRTASVYVSMSRHEAFGITLLEAAAAGSTVIASDIPAHREVARYASRAQIILVDPGVTSRALAESIADAADSRQGWPQGTTQVPSWPDMALAIAHEYERCLAR